MIKTESYVQEAAGGMVYRLIPVTEEIIRCSDRKRRDQRTGVAYN